MEEGHYTWRGTIQRAWIGPTKASVSLVWLIKSYRKGDTSRRKTDNGEKFTFFKRDEEKTPLSFRLFNFKKKDKE